jgi:hypothetical protein
MSRNYKLAANYLGPSVANFYFIIWWKNAEYNIPIIARAEFWKHLYIKILVCFGLRSNISTFADWMESNEIYFWDFVFYGLSGKYYSYILF